MMSTPRSRRASVSRWFAATSLSLGLLAAAPAAQNDRAQPMQVTARHFDGYQKPDSISTLKGDVAITQGSLHATGDDAQVYLDGQSAISRVVLTGTPARIEQTDDHGNVMRGHASRIDYDNVNGIAVLSGGAVVTQEGRGEAHGDRLTYNTQTSQMTGESGGDGLVHMTFLPRTKPAAPAPARTGSTRPPAAPASVRQR